MKDLIPIDEFIEKHLSQDCVTMVGHIHNNQLLPEISKYFENETDHSPKSILTLLVKIFDYYSCMRNFDVCDFFQAGILNRINQLVSSEPESTSAFQNDKIEAQYLIVRAYQYRNYKPVENFKLSEEYFIASERLTLNLLNKDNISKVDQQASVDLLFNSLISRFWLYVNYSNSMDKADKLLQEMDDRLDTVNLPADLLLAYSFFVGCYYLKKNDYEKAISVFKSADDLKETDESRWFFEKLKNPIKENLDKAVGLLREASTKLDELKKPPSNVTTLSQSGSPLHHPKNQNIYSSDPIIQQLARP